MDLRYLIRLLIWIVVAVLVLWLTWWVLEMLGLPDPIGRILFVLICLLVILGILDRSGIWSWRTPPPP